MAKIPPRKVLTPRQKGGWGWRQGAEIEGCRYGWGVAPKCLRDWKGSEHPNNDDQQDPNSA